MRPKPVPTSPRHDPTRQRPPGVSQTPLAVVVLVSVFTAALSAGVVSWFFLFAFGEGASTSGTIFRLPTASSDRIDEKLLDRLERSLMTVYRPTPNEATTIRPLGEAVGTAVAVSEDGWVVSRVRPSAGDIAGRTAVDSLAFERVVTDPATGLTFSKTNARSLAVLAFADRELLRPGDPLIVAELDPTTFNLRVVRVTLVDASARPADPLIQTSETFADRLRVTPIPSVKPGALLVTTSGDIAGIATEDPTTFVPADGFSDILDSLLSDGVIRRPTINVQYLDLSRSAVVPTDLRQTQSAGALIVGSAREPAVVPDGPADRAGLRSGDIIRRWNGLPIDASHSLPSRLFSFRPGSTVTLDVRRSGGSIEVSVTLGESVTQP